MHTILILLALSTVETARPMIEVLESGMWIRSCAVSQMIPVGVPCKNSAEFFAPGSTCQGIGFTEHPDRDVLVSGWHFSYCEGGHMMPLIDVLCLLRDRGLQDSVFWPDDLSLCQGMV